MKNHAQSTNINELVTIRKFSEVSGYSEKAIRNKIERLIWLPNIHYRKAPDHRILIDVAAINRWITQ